MCPPVTLASSVLKSIAVSFIYGLQSETHSGDQFVDVWRALTNDSYKMNLLQCPILKLPITRDSYGFEVSFINVG